MPLPGGGTTRIKRDQSLSSNPTSRSISIQWAMVHFGGMGSPNIYNISVAPNGALVAPSVPAQPKGDLATRVEAVSPSSISAFFSVG